MPGLTCNCSRCGILLRLMHSAPPGAPILCVHCSGLRDAVAQELPRAQVVSEPPSPPAQEPAVSTAAEPVASGLGEDRAWERLQARQRKLGPNRQALGRGERATAPDAYGTYGPGASRGLESGWAHGGERWL